MAELSGREIHEISRVGTVHTSRHGVNCKAVAKCVSYSKRVVRCGMHANVRAVVRAGRDAAGPVARGHSIRNAPHFIGIEGQDFAPSWQSQVF